MADKSKTIEIIFGGVDKTGSAAKSVGKNLQALESSVGSVTAPLADITDSILKLDAALAAAAIGLTGYAIKVADDFGTAFAEISTLIDIPAENLGKFKDQIQIYAESSTRSFDDITAATYGAISAGVDYGDSLNVVAEAEKLAIGGRAELGASTELLVSVINAFGGSMSDASSFADSLFTTVRLGKTTIPELTASMSNILPVASAAGLSFDEMNAAIAVLTADTGATTKKAITSLGAAISSIIAPSKTASDLAAKLGIDFNATALESKGLAGIMEQVRDKTGGSVEVMAKLFSSQEALKAVLPLTSTSFEKFNTVLGQYEQKAGAASTASAKMFGDLGDLGQVLKNNVTSAFISFGDNFTDNAVEIVQSTTSIFNSLGKEIKLDNGAFAPVIAQLDGVFVDIQRKFEAISKNFPEAIKKLDFDDLITAFDDLGNEMGDLFKSVFGDVDLTTIEGLSKALQTVVDAFTSLTNITSGIFSGLEPLFKLIGEGVEQFKKLSEEEKKSIGEMLGLATAIDKVLPAVGALSTGMNVLGGGMIALAGSKGIPAIVGNLDKLKAVASVAGKGGLIGAALFGAAGTGAAIGEGINKIYEAISGSSIGSDLYDLTHGEDFIAQQERAAKAAYEVAKEQKISAEIQKNYNDLIGDGTEVRALDIDSLNKQASALVGVSDSISKNGDAVEKAATFTEELANNNKSLAVTYDESGEKINSWSGTVIKSKKTLKEQNKAVDKAIEKSEEYQLKLLEIASDERIANIEANISLDIAQLEADTKVAVSIIESLGTTINSTGNLIGSLFGELGDASKYDKLGIAQQIEKENKLREKAAKLQAELTRAQIDSIEAKTRSIENGESLMRIQLDDSITPALELVMREILDKTRVWASEAGDNFLLGV